MRGENYEEVIPDVRLRYSTIVNYAFTIYRLFTSLAFVVIVARRFPIGEFALWGVLLSFLAMLSSLVTFWNFWARRFYMRGIEGSFGTCLVLNLLYLIPASLAYIAMSYLVDLVLGWGLNYLLLGLPLLPLYILTRFVDSALGMVKPEGVGYRSFVYETSRLLFAIAFVLMLNMGLPGAIYAMGFSLALSMAFGFSMLIRLKAISLKFVPRLVREWARGFYVPLMNSVAGFLEGSVRAVTSWIAGSELPVAYLNVGVGVQAPITRASWSSSLALYPRIMKRRSGEDVSETIRIYLTITGFMFVSLIALSKGIVSLYNPKYLDAYPILFIVAIYSLILGLNRIFLTVLRGAAEEDREGVLDYRKILGSYLFKAPLFQMATIIPGYGMGIALLFIFHGNYLMEAAGMLSGLLVSSALLLPILLREARRSVPSTFPWREAGVAGAASVAALAYYIMSGASDVVVKRFWMDAPILAAHMIVAMAIYFTVEFALSSWFRELVRRALHQLEKIRS